MDSFYSDMSININYEITEKAQYLYDRAKELVDTFHKEREDYLTEMKRSKQKYRPPCLICRVTRNKTLVGITISWCHNQYAGERGRRRTFSNYIKRGKSFSYPENKVFTYMTLDWEKRMFNELEPKFAILRRHSLELGKLSRAVMNYDIALEKIPDTELKL